MLINVILSGGAGTRLWPLSTPIQPKQFIPLIKGRSLFMECISRNMEFVDSTVVILQKEHLELAKQQAKKEGLHHGRFIAEGAPKNTAPAVAMAALDAKPKDILFVTPADHVIEVNVHYLQAMRKAVKLAESGQLVLFGIKPGGPETGYGYIEHVGSKVISFHEKPAKEIAQSYLENGKHLWNSGMFCFRADVYLEALEKFQPTLFKCCQVIKNLQKRKEDVPASLYDLIPSISIDHAVMEQAKNICVITSLFNWTDIGSFDALSKYMENSQDDYNQQVYSTGNRCSSNFILNQVKKPIALVGVEDIMVIQTETGMLICRKGDSQQVKEVYKSLVKQQP